MGSTILKIAVLLVLLASGLLGSDSSPAKVARSHAATATCDPISPPPCKDGVSPGVVQITPDGAVPSNKFKLARKRFYLSSCPFNLASSANIATAPALRSFYTGAGASPQLISWLEENHCETIYCHQLTVGEAACEGIDSNKCVPEFRAAYQNALTNLKGNTNLALKMITNYAPLSDPKLRIGFYEARTEWLKIAVSKIEGATGNNYRIRTTVTDKDGIGFFYDLCPGTYYISSVAPIDIDGVETVWDTAKPVKVDGPPDMKTATRVTLAFPPSKDKKNYFVGKPVSDFASPKPAAQ